MRIAEIDWPLFWQALNRLDPATRDHWVSRWVFADDAVKLSRRSAGDAEGHLGDPARRDKDFQGLLMFEHLVLRQTRAISSERAKPPATPRQKPKILK